MLRNITHTMMGGDRIDAVVHPTRAAAREHARAASDHLTVLVIMPAIRRETALGIVEVYQAGRVVGKRLATKDDITTPAERDLINQGLLI